MDSAFSEILDALGQKRILIPSISPIPIPSDQNTSSILPNQNVLLLHPILHVPPYLLNQNLSSFPSTPHIPPINLNQNISLIHPIPPIHHFPPIYLNHFTSTVDTHPVDPIQNDAKTQTVLIVFSSTPIIIDDSLVDRLWAEANPYIGKKHVAIGVKVISLDLNKKTNNRIQNLKKNHKNIYFVCLTITDVENK